MIECSRLMGFPPNPPIVGLDMEDGEEERKRQVALLMGQILSPVWNLCRMFGGLV